MSYTSDVKGEILRNPEGGRKTRNMELAGILAGDASILFQQDGISFTIRTDSNAYVRYLYKLTEELYGCKPEISVERKPGGAHRRYRLSYPEALEMLTGTGLLERGKHWYSPVFQDIQEAGEKQKRAFLKGVFLSCGSIANPERSYHLEINCSEALAETTCDLLESFGIHAGITPHKGHFVVYLKDSEELSDFLRLVGAHHSLMDFENVRINKEIRNDVNRQVNCETANLNKTVDAASRELEAIAYLRKTGQFDKLPEDLKKVAALRENYPDESTTELLALCTEKLSRSTLHRRLKKLVHLHEAALAEEES